METIYGRSRVNVKVERGSTFTFTQGLSYSNRDKSPYNVHTKDKTGVLTCGQFKSVNNHSERRAKAEAVISHKSIALLSRYKSVGALIYFH